jgi:Fe-Mn family superoxide dismutase
LTASVQTVLRVSLSSSAFRENLAPGGGAPKGMLESAIKADFGSFDKMKEEMSAKTIAVQGR